MGGLDALQHANAQRQPQQLRRNFPDLQENPMLSCPQQCMCPSWYRPLTIKGRHTSTPPELLHVTC